MPIGESLVKSGVITQEQLAKALEEQKEHPGEKIGQILLRLGYLPVEELESLL
jgi:type IV pilus assembly protein PilB